MGPGPEARPRERGLYSEPLGLGCSWPSGVASRRDRAGGSGLQLRLDPGQALDEMGGPAPAGRVGGYRGPQVSELCMDGNGCGARLR
jgi:hypothetical protein